MTTSVEARERTEVGGEGQTAFGVYERALCLDELDLSLRRFRVPATPAQRSALRASLERHGQQQPVLATARVARGRLVVVDGFKRVAALDAAGGERRVRIAVAELDGAGALAAMRAANAARRGLSDLEEAWIIASLHRDHGLSQGDIAARFGRHKSWVCRRLALHERLEAAVQDDVRLGLVSTSAARELARLPRGNQALAAQAVASHGLSCQQARRLVAVLRKTSPEERGAVLSDPLSHLPAVSRDAPAGLDRRLGPTGNVIRDQLLRVHAAASRLEQVLVEGAPELRLAERQVLGRLARPTRERASAALARVEKIMDAPGISAVIEPAL